MKRTEILANVGNAFDAMNNLSTVHPSMIPRPPCIPPIHIKALPILHTGLDSQILCSASDPYSTELDGQSNSFFSGFDDLVSGVTAHSVRLELEQVNRNDSSSSDKDYHQSDDRDHYFKLEEVISDSGEEDLEDQNCLKLL
eukprot:6088220-Ditylum_brightwellii.AAC.1